MYCYGWVKIGPLLTSFRATVVYNSIMQGHNGTHPDSTKEIDDDLATMRELDELARMIADNYNGPRKMPGPLLFPPLKRLQEEANKHRALHKDA